MKILINGFSQMVGVAGGVERVLINFANEMAQRGHEVLLVYCTEKRLSFCYPVDKRVKCINLVDLIPDHKYESIKPGVLFKIKREILRLIDTNIAKNLNVQFEIKKLQLAIFNLIHENVPDIIISAWPRGTAAFVSADLERRFPLITMIHIDMDSMIKWLTERDKCALEQCDTVQVLMRSYVDKTLKISKKINAVYIPNAVPQYPLIDKMRNDLIVEIARLGEKDKRQHLLIEAFARIAHQYPTWNLEFWGEGSEAYKKRLITSIKKYHLEDRIKLCGNTDDVLSVYQRASIFAFPSAFEGFGLAMAEAMSAGLPVVAYRSCPAVNELVRDGETGLLVDDGVDALAEGLKKLMEDQELRERMGRAAHESMKEFAPEKIWDQWEALMQDVIAKHKAKMER